MELISTKKMSDLKLDGITVTELRFDNSKWITGLRLEDKVGNVIDIGPAQYAGNLDIKIKKPVELVKRFLLSCMLLGLKVEETFKTIEEATDRKNKFLSSVTDITDNQIEIKEVEVPE